MPTRVSPVVKSVGRRRSQRSSSRSNRPATVVVESCVFPSQLGWIGLTAERQEIGELAITRLAFGHTSAAAARAALDSAAASGHPHPIPEERWAERASVGQTPETRAIPATWVTDLQAFAAGSPTDLSHLPLELSYLTDFGLRVVMACRQIPWGQTISYGELATRIGTPGAARAVGGVMARNRHPLIVPCHRVLASNGALTGFSAPQGLVMKQRLLAHERSQNPPTANLRGNECGSAQKTPHKND